MLACWRLRRVLSRIWLLQLRTDFPFLQGGIMSRVCRRFSAAVLLSFLIGSVSHANGFKILGVKSTRATSMGESFIVQADDPSAVAFNPAGLSQLQGTQISNGVTITNGWVRHKGAGGSEGLKDEWQIVPNFFLSTRLKNKDVVAGIGITVPNGLSSDWHKTGFARYVSTFSDLRVIEANPAVGWKANEKLSLGLGISYYSSDVTLKSMLDYGILAGAPGALDGESKLTGSGDSWGFNMGLIYRASQRHGLAATFKSAYKIDYSGNILLTDIPAFLGIGSVYSSDIESSMNYPAVVVLGYAYWPRKNLKFEFNVDWTNWETLDSVVVKVDNPAPPLVPGRIVQEYGFDNTVAYKFGVEYGLSEKLKLRGGYVYNENATPEANWRPSLPDTDTHFVTAGLGYQAGRFTIDGGVQAIFYEDRTIDNNVDGNETTSSSSIDGEYENVALGYSITVTYRF